MASRSAAATSTGPAEAARVGLPRSGASLTGTHVDPHFIEVGPGTYIGGLAVDSTHIYWTNRDKSTVGRADLDGSHVNLKLITDAREPNGLAIEQNHLYWANDPRSNVAESTIGRAQLDGSHVQETFIAGVHEPFGVVADAHSLYWANYAIGTIGRASLNGTHVDQSFIAAGAKAPEGNGESAPMGVALGVAQRARPPARPHKPVPPSPPAVTG